MLLGSKEKLLSLRDVLTDVPISRPTLHRLLKSNQLPYYKVGRRVFVRLADLRDFLEACHVR